MMNPSGIVFQSLLFISCALSYRSVVIDDQLNYCCCTMIRFCQVWSASLSFRGNHGGSELKCLQTSSIDVFVWIHDICSYSDKMAAAKVQNSEDLKILLEDSSLPQHKWTSSVAYGVFKEDEAEQQLLLSVLVLLRDYNS